MSCTVFEETSTGLNWEGGLNDVFVLQIKQTVLDTVFETSLSLNNKKQQQYSIFVSDCDITWH